MIPSQQNAERPSILAAIIRPIFVFGSALIAGLATSGAAFGQETSGAIPTEGSPLTKTTALIQYDLGFLGVQNHRLMLSRDNTFFDYLKDGAQDNLFKFERYTLNINFTNSDRLKLLYQPLRIETKVTLKDDLLVENVLFPRATPMALTYNFPYYRASYLWDLIASRDLWIGLGGGIQARNATITFADLAGSQLVSVRDVGPVPLFSAAIEAYLGASYRLHFDVEGNYANTSFINGDDDDGVRGAILDTALSVSFQPSEHLQVISSLRYIGGGAEGQSDEADTASGDGYASNWIDVAAFSAGVSYQLID